MKPKSIPAVDDERGYCELLVFTVSPRGFKVVPMQQIFPQQKVIVLSSGSDINHTFEERLKDEINIVCFY